MSDKKELTAKQKLFCSNYLSNGFNATQAAITAGYSEDTAFVIGYENLNKPYIRKYLDNHIDHLIGDRKGLTLDLVAECKKYAFMSPADMEEQQVRASDKKQFADMLFKFLGSYVDRKEIEHSTVNEEGEKVGIDYSKISDKALEELIAATKPQ